MNSKKLDLFLGNLALQWSPFGPKWDSSAKQLEESLRARGINIKLYYEYKLPGGMVPSEFMRRIAVLDFCVDFSFGRAVDVLFGNKLNLREKVQVFFNVVGRKLKSRERILEYAKQIQKLNPELRALKIVKDTDAFNICSGAMFGFAPGEIKYFITDYKGMGPGTKDREFADKINGYGVVSAYVLAPQTAEKIISALEKNKQGAMINKNGREIK